MPTATKNDVLASNLLLGVLAISLVEQLVAAYLRNQTGYAYTPSQTTSAAGPTDWFGTAAVWGPLLLGMLVAAGTYYAVRKGQLWAKLLVVVTFLLTVYGSTSRRDGLLLGVPVAHLLSWALLAWLKAALTLAAIGLMFWPRRTAAS